MEAAEPGAADVVLFDTTNVSLEEVHLIAHSDRSFVYVTCSSIGTHLNNTNNTFSLDIPGTLLQIFTFM
jgi:hypothetical protein